jgi:hypothetical protein
VSENILPASVNLVALDVHLENVKVLNAQTKFIFLSKSFTDTPKYGCVTIVDA